MSGKKGRSMAGLPWIAAMAFFMQALDATILNTALPAIAQSLNRSPLAMQSAIISYTLTVAMLIPVSGWLADRFGTRRVFMLAVTLFTLGSLACALSSSLTELVIFRVLQGVGGAMMMPVARLALLRAYPRSELLPILNFVTMPGLVGPILGPVLGGVFVTWVSWHWIFLINVPVVVEDDPNATAVTGVYLSRSDGVMSLERPSTDDGIAVLNVPGQSPQTISVPARTLEECLSEELGRLYPDEIYAEVVTQGWDLINPKR